MKVYQLKRSLFGTVKVNEISRLSALFFQVGLIGTAIAKSCNSITTLNVFWRLSVLLCMIQKEVRKVG